MGWGQASPWLALRGDEHVVLPSAEPWRGCVRVGRWERTASRGSGSLSSVSRSPYSHPSKQGSPCSIQLLLGLPGAHYLSSSAGRVGLHTSWREGLRVGNTRFEPWLWLSAVWPWKLSCLSFRLTMCQRAGGDCEDYTRPHGPHV